MSLMDTCEIFDEILSLRNYDLVMNEKKKPNPMQKLPHHRSKTLPTLASPSLLLPAPPAPIVMDYHGLSWIITDYHGLSWIIMDYHGLSWIIITAPPERIILDYHHLLSQIIATCTDHHQDDINLHPA